MLQFRREAINVLSLFAIGTSMLLAKNEAFAFQLNYGLEYQALYTDNVYLDPELPVEDLIHIGLLRVEMEEEGAATSFYTRATHTWLKYEEESFDDQQYSTLDASFFWQITPRQLSWTLQDNYRQVPVVTDSPETPDNLQNTNAFVTGPNYLIRLGALNSMEFGIRYGRYDFEITDADSDRYLGTAKLQRLMTENLTVSLNYEALDVKYRTELEAGNYYRTDTYFNANWTPVSSEIDIDLGSTILYPEGEDSITGFLGRLLATRNITLESTIGINLVSEYSDAGREIEYISVQNTQHTFVGEIGSRDIFRARRGELIYNNTGDPLTFSLRVFGEQIDYINATQDRNSSGADVRLGYRPTPANLFELGYRYREVSYLEDETGFGARNDTEKYSSARWQYRMTPHFSAAIEGRKNVRESDNEAFNYVENVGIFFLIYEG